MIKSISLLTLILVLLSNTNSFGAQNREAEIEKYIKTLSSPSIKLRIENSKNISNSMITDVRLYDEVEKVLLSRGYYVENPGENFEQVDEISWLCKTLASSGNEKYRPTIQEVKNNTNSLSIKRHANKSLGLFVKYRVRNATINAAVSQDQDSTLSPEDKRIASMLRSDILNLKRDGAKIVSRKSDVDEKIYDIVNDELLANFHKSQEVRIIVDTTAWLCKALASSKNPKYIPTLEKVAYASYNVKLKKHAQKALVTITSGKINRDRKTVDAGRKQVPDHMETSTYVQSDDREGGWSLNECLIATMGGMDTDIEDCYKKDRMIKKRKSIQQQ